MLELCSLIIFVFATENKIIIRVTRHPVRDAVIFILLITSVALVAVFLATKFYRVEKQKATAGLYTRGHYNSRLDRATLSTAPNNASSNTSPPYSQYDNMIGS